MTKRMKLSFSIEQILGLQDKLADKLAEQEKVAETIISSVQESYRSPEGLLSAEYRSPTLSSPGSDGFNDYSSDDGKQYTFSS